MEQVADELHELHRGWSEWTGMIRLFADTKMRRGEVSQDEYDAVHARLQESLADPGLKQFVDAALLEKMRNLSAPWINVDALAGADALILKDLVVRCDAIEQEWMGGKKSSKAFATGLIMAVLFISVFVFVLGVDKWADLYGMLFDGKNGTVPEWIRALERNRGHVRIWVMGGSVVAATALVAWFVFRPPRNY